MCKICAKDSLPGSNGQGDVVLRWRHGTDIVGIVGTIWVVSSIEIQKIASISHWGQTHVSATRIGLACRWLNP